MKTMFAASVALGLAAVPSWEQYKTDFNKVYNGDEDDTRKAIFEGKMTNLETHNAKYDAGEETWFMAVNQFSDWTEEEFVDTMLMKEFQSLLNHTLTGVPVVDEVPANLQLGDKQWSVSPVKDQGSCGSCWAFGAVAGMEGSAKKDLGSSAILSEQYVMDCTSGSGACSGGRADSAYPKLYGKALYTESSYPYTARGGSCKSSGTDSGLRISKFTRSFPSSGSDSQLASALDSNPLVVAVGASSWSSYGGGVYSGSTSCSLNHQVYATGYDSSSIKVKNSWGRSWGESGYIRLARTSSGCGTSGILADGGFYPTMSSSSDLIV